MSVESSSCQPVFAGVQACSPRLPPAPLKSPLLGAFVSSLVPFGAVPSLREREEQAPAALVELSDVRPSPPGVAALTGSTRCCRAQ